MKAILRATAVCAAAIVTTFSAGAQVFEQRVRTPQSALSQAQMEKIAMDYQVSHPQSPRGMFIRPRHSKNTVTGVRRVQTAAPLKAEAAPGVTIWGNVLYLDNWYGENFPYGYYSFQPTSQVQFNLLYQQERNYSNNGVGYKDGHLYQMSLDDKFRSINICSEVLYDFDTSTWTRTNDSIARDSSALRYDLIALETAQGPDGTVYGQFYSADRSRLEWGTIDYTTLTRTTFGQCTRTYVALGVTKQHELYGVAADGNLYKISTTDGTETLVGSTGLAVTQNGGYYYQSGEIDQSTNTFYWAAVIPDGDGMMTGLYTVDLQTGAATKVGSYTGQVLGLVIPSETAQDGAPEKVADLALSFTAPSLSGTVSFTVPTKTFSGSALSGQVNYVITANDDTIATGTAQAGTRVSEPVSVAKSGLYNFVVTTATAAGESPKASASQWIGYDIPQAPTAVTATLSGNSVAVSWTAPTAGVNGAYLGSLTYDVTRVNGTNGDSTVIATATSATNVSDQLPADAALGYYYYNVTAHNGDQQSAPASSNGFTYGSAITPDWTTTFDTEGDFGLFHVTDANHDGRTWRYYANEQVAMSDYNSANGNDDWLYTPAIRLDKSHTYILSYKVRNVNSGYPNSLEVKWGSDTTAAAMTSTLLSTTTPGGDWTVYTHELAPAADGIYYIGFHDNTAQNDQYALQLDSVSIVKSASVAAPDSVSELSVVPGTQGLLQAKVTFRLPSKSVDGQELTGKITQITVKRDSVVFKSYPKEGKTTTYNPGSKFDAGTDKGMTSGWHTYTVVCSNSQGQGRVASKRVYIGIDAPDRPTGLKLTDDTTAVVASWNPFPETGVNGAYLDPNDIAVSFFDHYTNYWNQQVVGDSITTSAKGALSLRLPQNPETSVNRGAQSLYYLCARADGSMGQSRFVFTPSIVVGPSISLPFRETFASGSVDNQFIWVEGNEQYRNRDDAAGWIMETTGDADNNGGAVFWKEYTESSYYGEATYTIEPGDEASVNMPKVSLLGATNPMLLFQVYATQGEQARLKVLVQTPDGVDHDGAEINLAETAADGWTQHSFSLSQYAGQRYVIVKFRGISESAATNIGIDDITIYDQPAYNLAATSLVAPDAVSAGSEADVQVNVRNTGSNAASGYKVVLYADGEPVDTVTAGEPLASLAEAAVSLTYNVPTTAKDTISFSAEVVYDLDLEPEDNTTAAVEVPVRQSGYPAVADLSASASSASVVNLAWGAPVIPAPQQVTEDFESYSPFATSFGDWTTFDGDKGRAAAVFSSNPIPVYGQRFAFTAFNPNAVTDEVNVLEVAPGLTPHSGNQFAASIYSYGSSDVIDADNWLISPALSGNSQTVRFYVFNVAVQDGNSQVPFTETFDVLYSTTTTDTAAFHKIESGQADGTNLRNVAPNWKEVSVEVPAGAEYFAIHQTTDADHAYIFGIDDVSYEKGSLGAHDSIVAYIIYRDGQRIGQVDGTAHEFTVDDAGSGHTYNVAVVYLDRQGNRHVSPLSNDAFCDPTGISAISTNGNHSYDVYTIDGKAVGFGLSSLKGLQRGVYVVNGSKYVIK